MAILAKIAKNDDFEASWNSGQKMARILAKISRIRTIFMIFGQRMAKKWPKMAKNDLKIR